MLNCSIRNKIIEENTILSDVNLALPNKGFFILKGENGAGKSTLLKILSGEDKLFDGEVTFNKRNIKNINSEAIYIGEDINLFEGETVRQNFRHIRKLKDDDYLELLSKVNLDGFLNENVANLSSGERRRVVIVICLLLDCKVLLCDEITNNLDKDNKDSILKILYDLSKEKLIILATNDNSITTKEENIILLKNKTASFVWKNEEIIENENIKGKKSYSTFNKFEIFIRVLLLIFEVGVILLSSFTSDVNNEYKHYAALYFQENKPLIHTVNPVSDIKTCDLRFNNYVPKAKNEKYLNTFTFGTYFLSNNVLNNISIVEGRLPIKSSELLIPSILYNQFETTFSEINSYNNSIVGVYDSNKINVYNEKYYEFYLNKELYDFISYLRFSYVSILDENIIQSEARYVYKTKDLSLKYLEEKYVNSTIEPILVDSENDIIASFGGYNLIANILLISLTSVTGLLVIINAIIEGKLIKRKLSLFKLYGLSIMRPITRYFSIYIIEIATSLLGLITQPLLSKLFSFAYLNEKIIGNSFMIADGQNMFILILCGAILLSSVIEFLLILRVIFSNKNDLRYSLIK